VPRHPERFDTVAALIKAHGFTLARRTQDHLPRAQHAVLLGDTLGELTFLYGLSDVAFIGGSLIKRGGHNMLEAAIWSIPLAAGPFMDNFQQLNDDLIACGALLIVNSAESLAEFFLNCQKHPDIAHNMGCAGRDYLLGNQGAVDKIHNRIVDLLAAQ
jgi:3-deoxy-D-manno-octulosonic-acid transferase